MITANERAQEGLDLFEINGSQSFEMENETLKICASEDGTIHRSVPWPRCQRRRRKLYIQFVMV
jgi:hypothetical protein